MSYLQRWRIYFIVIVCLGGVYYALPNFASFSFLPNQTINLGLDLQGGSSLLLEVDLDSVEADYMRSLGDEVRRALRRGRIAFTDYMRKGYILSFRLRKEKDDAVVRSALSSVIGPSSRMIKHTDGLWVIEVSKDAVKRKKELSISQSIEIVRRRIDEMGTKEPSIQRQGSNRILVQLPGVDDPAQAKVLLGKTAKLAFRLVHSVYGDGKGRPANADVLESEERSGEKLKYVVMRHADVSGEMLVDAQPSYDQNGAPAVSFNLDAIGAKRFGSVTQNNVGRQFAIVLDGKVISAPVIQVPILGGSGIIVGNFTLSEAHDLAILLRAGALPAPLQVLEERTVGPDLGADSIAAGKQATVWAVVSVLVFMFVFYGVFLGGVANIALTMNLVLLLASLSLIQATLTLPGIAGIALTLGMAVDANVLIFERIREELGEGYAPLSAVSSGFSRALATIVDSNVTTLIGAALLYQFGTGAVRGFAVTLALGIIISMFTAVSLTRLLILLRLRSLVKKQKEVRL